MLTISGSPTRSRLAVSGVTMLATFSGGALLMASRTAVQPSSTPRDPDAALLLITWWLSAALLLWWTMSTVSWTVALRSDRLRRQPSWRHKLERFSAPGTRKLAEGMLAIGLVTLPACSPGGEATSPTLVFVEHIEAAEAAPLTSLDAPITTLPTSTTPTTVRATTTTAPPTTSEAPAPASQQEEEGTSSPSPSGDTEVPAARHHEVVAGDNLWSIAEAHMTANLQRTPNSAEIARYWRTLIAENRERISSGQPDLIHPGELIELPALTGA